MIMKFHEEQRLMILVATFSGLYTPSIEKIIKHRSITVILKYFTLVPILSCGIFCGGAVKHLISDQSHHFEKTYDVAIICAFYLIVYKLVFYNLSNKKIEKVFEMWYSSFSDDAFADRKEEMLRKTKKKANRQIVVLAAQSVVSCLFWGIPPFFDSDKTLNHPTGIPYKQQSPDYELVVGFELLVAVYCVSGITFDSVLMVLLSLAQVQAIHLKQSLSEIVNIVKVNTDGQILLSSHPDFVYADNDDGKSVPYWNESPESFDTKEMERKLRIWITHHQQLIRFYRELGLVYYTPLCMQFVNIVINVCLLLFLNSVGAMTGLDTAVSFLFSIATYSMFYINCRFGDAIKDASDLIFEDTFTEAWYVYPKHIQALFHIILMQSQTPMDIVAFDIYPLGARSFFKIFKTAYTFFTFLLQIMNKRR